MIVKESARELLLGELVVFNLQLCGGDELVEQSTVKRRHYDGLGMSCSANKILMLKDEDD